LTVPYAVQVVHCLHSTDAPSDPARKQMMQQAQHDT
jgi:hypothetical protein